MLCNAKTKDDRQQLEAIADYRHEWNSEELRRIAGPLFNLLDWSGVDADEIEACVRVLYKHEVDQTKCKSDKDIAFLHRLGLYVLDRKSTVNTTCPLKATPVSADLVYPVIQPLLLVDPSKWTSDQVQKVVSLLKGVTLIDAAGSQQISVQTYNQFLPLWERYLAFHPDLLKVLDPFYVICNVGKGFPKGLASAVSGYPPTGSPHLPLVPMDGSNHAFVFNTEVEAQYFMGWIQGACAGLRIWFFRTVAPAVAY